MSALPRKYAVQKPKGSKWETLALVDDPGTAREEFRDAIGRHGTGYVRLIQVDFKSEDALSDYDWRLIELHDPFGGKGPRPNLKVVAGNELMEKPKAAARPAAAPSTGPARPGTPPRPGEKVPVPIPTYVVAFLFGAVSLILWAVWFGV